MENVLITGAAGRVGRVLVPRLRKGRRLRLLDLSWAADDALAESGETVTGSVTDPEVMAAACAGTDAVIHLAGHPSERPWEEILAVNVDGTRTVLEAARAASVPRVVLASSVHAAGFRHIGTGLAADSAPQPDTYYGFSKAAVESLGSLYHSRFGLDVICVRIGSCSPRPKDRHALGLWLSPDDAGRLFTACLTARSPGLRTVWGVSANTRGWCSLAEGTALGYRPVDDSERYAAELPADRTESPYLGGRLFTGTELGRPMTAEQVERLRKPRSGD
ncbi:NAD(P)-dependent oxidoreductase [Streptomyces sp. NA04227]|uniref:NAD-dependent epimerase/dehydratase family protein n=1 Tax=Streptomyces sp. NA04227 TaxID=2742136 RepID=UPI0020CA5E32|nr:NAD(P)-dependent oxidoreductase [Streptomyces sp. NA04227]